MAPLVIAEIVIGSLKALVYMAALIAIAKTIKGLPKNYMRYAASVAIARKKAEQRANELSVSKVEEETIVESFIPHGEQNLSQPAFLRNKVSIVELGFIFENGKLVKQPEMPIQQHQKQLRDSLLQEAVEVPAGAFGAVAS